MLAACTAEQEAELFSVAEKVSFVIDSEVPQTKGNAVTVDPSVVKEVTLAAYCNGTLADCRHFTGTSGLYLFLNKGQAHKVLAIANMGDRSTSMPASLTEALKMSETLGWSSINSKGFPMTGSADYSAGSQSVSISVKRVLAKVTLRIDTNWPEGSSFTLKSITVGNSNGSVSLFGESRATSKSDLISGDYTATLSNPMVFYLPENLQGNLLPSNRDPYRKNLENLQASGKSAAAELSSYMDVVLTQQDTYGVSGDRRYRFYIGSDNTSNFDVTRNTDYEISLKLTIDGFNIVDNWKVDNSDVSDGRSLAFRSKEYYVSPGIASYIGINYSVGGTIDNSYSYFNSQNGWSFYDTDASLKLGPFVSGNGIQITAITGKASIGDRIPVKVRTFDNVHSDTAYINVTPGDVTTRWKNSFTPLYIAQKGTIEAVVPQGIDRVSFEVSDGSSDKLEIAAGESDNSASVSLIGSGLAKITMVGHIGERTVMLGEKEIEILAPLLTATSESIAVSPTGSRSTLMTRYKSIEGVTMTPNDNVADKYFDKNLYDRLLKPVSVLAVEEAGLFLATSNVGVFADKVNASGKDILDYCGKEHSTTLTFSPTDTRVAEQIAPATVECYLTDPFPDAADDRFFGYINNKYDGYVGTVHSTALDVTDKKSATFGTKVSDFTANVYVSGGAPDMTYSYSGGKISLARKDGSQYSAGSYKLYGKIYNTNAKAYSAQKTLGEFESYLFTGFVANATEFGSGYNISASFANRFNISHFSTLINNMKNKKIFIFHQGPTRYMTTQYYVFDHAEDDQGNYIDPESNDFYTWGSWCDVNAYDTQHMVACNETIYFHHIGRSDEYQWEESGDDFFSAYSPLISVDGSQLTSISGMYVRSISNTRVIYSSLDLNKGKAGVPYHLVGLPASTSILVPIPWNR